MLGFIPVILLARWFPGVLVAFVVGTLLWLVVVGMATMDPDTRLGLELLGLIVGCVAGAIWLLVRLFRVEPAQVKPVRREPRL
jgi:hypothetical protein